MHELALFAGAGGGILGSMLLGWRTVCAVEINAYCARRLMQRQNEGHLPPFPIWDDVRTFNGHPWRGFVDVVSGGFPCQDISPAGKRLGLDGEHSGLWREMVRIVSEVQPLFVVVENSAHLRTRGLVRVLKDLDGLGYDTARGVLRACNCGSPHLRKRMWIVAHSNSNTLWKQQRRIEGKNRESQTELGNADWWPLDLIQGVDDGMAHRMERCRATGNGQIPTVACLAWETLKPRL